MKQAKSNPALALWQDLTEAGIVHGDFPVGSIGSPWYVKILLGFSGWLAALFLLGFFAVGLEQLLASKPASLVSGGILLVIAFFMLRRQQRNPFVGQLALAFSLAGQGLVVWTLVESLGEQAASTWFLVALFEVVLAWVMPDFVHRVFSAFAVGISLSVMLALQREPHLQPALLFAVVCGLWLQELRFPALMSRVVPFAYGLTLALLCTKTVLLLLVDLASELRREQIEFMWILPWMGEALCALVTLGVVWVLLRRNHLAPLEPAFIAAMVAALVLCGISQEARGITIGLTLLLLGYAGANRVLFGLGVLALLLLAAVFRAA